MAEDRPLESAEQAIAALRAELEDFKSTANARMARLPTGTVLPTPATTPPAGTLLLQGQTLNRADYPALWAWAQATNAGGFGTGNGTTTFVLPDWRGRVPRGVAATGETVGQLVGADSRALTTANLPAHAHNVSVDDAGSHNHGSTGAAGGNHGGHFNTRSDIGVPDGSFHFVAPWNGGIGNDAHAHSTSNAGAHGHSVTESSVGSGTAVDIRQASVAVNYLIWC